MTRSWVVVLAAVACLATAPAVGAAQQPAARQLPAPATASPAAPAAGPRIEPGFKSYRPKFAQEEAVVSAAAADRTVITISTLGLVIIGILLILLLA